MQGGALTDGALPVCCSFAAEDMRKLKARVDELERRQGNEIYYETESSHKERLQGASPDEGAGAGRAGFGGSGGLSQEELWLFVRNRLLLEQEKGESHRVRVRSGSPQRLKALPLSDRCPSAHHKPLSASLPLPFCSQPQEARREQQH